MALESATYINGLVASNPTSSDNISDGDNHIRLIKSAIKTTFPNITGAVTSTHSAINSAVTAANAATNANTAGTIVKRDGSGNFTAGSINATTVTAALAGNATTATTLQTARTISLSGDVSGSVSFNGSQNVDISAVIADDSHNHVVGNIDNFTETVQDLVGAMFSGNSETGLSAVYQDSDGTIDLELTLDPTIELTGDVTGSGTMTNLGSVSFATTIADDSHNHIISNIDGLSAALDGKVDDSQVLTNVPANAVFTDTNTTYSVGDGGLTEKNFTTTLKNKIDGIESNATADQSATEIRSALLTVDGTGSGIDADQIDGKHIAVVSSMPGSPDANTIYFVT